MTVIFVCFEDVYINITFQYCSIYFQPCSGDSAIESTLITTRASETCAVLVANEVINSNNYHATGTVFNNISKKTYYHFKILLYRQLVGKTFITFTSENQLSIVFIVKRNAY